MFKLFVVSTCQTELRTDIIEFEYEEQANTAFVNLVKASGTGGVHYTVTRLYEE